MTRRAGCVNAHVRFCGGPGGATPLVYPAWRSCSSRFSSPFHDRNSTPSSFLGKGGASLGHRDSSFWSVPAGGLQLSPVFPCGQVEHFLGLSLSSFGDVPSGSVPVVHRSRPTVPTSRQDCGQLGKPPMGRLRESKGCARGASRPAHRDKKRAVESLNKARRSHLLNWIVSPRGFVQPPHRQGRRRRIFNFWVFGSLGEGRPALRAGKRSGVARASPTPLAAKVAPTKS